MVKTFGNVQVATGTYGIGKRIGVMGNNYAAWFRVNGGDSFHDFNVFKNEIPVRMNSSVIDHFNFMLTLGYTWIEIIARYCENYIDVELTGDEIDFLISEVM